MAAETYATLKTNRGDIVIHLFPNHAPKTVENFVGLAEGTKEYTDPKTGAVQHRAVLRRAGLPPGHRRLHDPGRLPARHRHRRPGLQVQGRVPPRAALRPARTCSRWPTPAPAPTARSSSSPSARRRWLNNKHTIFGEVADQASRDVVDAIATTPDRCGRPPGRAGGHRVRRDRAPLSTAADLTDPAGAPEPAAPVCYRHPDREAHIRCQRCERPICPDCMRPASVGFQCPDCVRRAPARPGPGVRRTADARSGNPALTSQVLIAINVAVWLLILATGWRRQPLVDRLALLPAGRPVPVPRRVAAPAQPGWPTAPPGSC